MSGRVEAREHQGTSKFINKKLTYSCKPCYFTDDPSVSASWSNMLGHSHSGGRRHFPANACPPADQAALMDFKAALKEPYLGIFNTWTGSNCCKGWNGVSCDPTTQWVADIVLRGESEDPIYVKAGRQKLYTLIVADWKDISSEIPAYVTSLPNLCILEVIWKMILKLENECCRSNPSFKFGQHSCLVIGNRFQA